MQAILTKYHGPTNTKPARITAYCAGGKVRVSYEHELTTDDAHRRAAMRLIEKMKWEYLFERHQLAQGGLPNGNGEAFVWVEKGK